MKSLRIFLVFQPLLDLYIAPRHSLITNRRDNYMNKLLRLPKVIDRTGLSKSSIYAFILAGTFPKPISLGERAVAWQESDISDWIEKRITASKTVTKGVAR